MVNLRVSFLQTSQTTHIGFRRPPWSCDGTTGQARGAGGLMLRWNFRGHEGLLDGLAGDFSWVFR